MKLSRISKTAINTYITLRAENDNEDYLTISIPNDADVSINADGNALTITPMKPYEK